MPRLRKTLTALTVVAVLGGLGVAAIASRPSEVAVAPAGPTKPAVVELAAIEVGKVARTSVEETVRVSGSLRPASTASLNARVGGTLERVTVDVGDAVAAGDIVAELDTDALVAEAAAQDANRAAMIAQRDLAAGVLERSRRLGQSGIASEAALLEAEANVLNLEAQLQGIDAQLADIRRRIGDAVVRAPFDGVVSARSVNPGETVALNTELLALVDLSSMELEAAVPTSRIGAVELGQIATFRVDGFATAFEGTVARIAPLAVAGSRSVSVFLTVDNDRGSLRGGMFATGDLRIRRREDIIALPAVSVRTDDAGSFVLKAEGERLVRQGVTTGESFAESGLVEIASGLDVGETVVTAPLPDLVADIQIRIAEL